MEILTGAANPFSIAGSSRRSQTTIHDAIIGAMAPLHARHGLRAVSFTSWGVRRVSRSLGYSAEWRTLERIASAPRKRCGNKVNAPVKKISSNDAPPRYLADGSESTLTSRFVFDANLTFFALRIPKSFLRFHRVSPALDYSSASCKINLAVWSPLYLPACSTPVQPRHDPYQSQSTTSRSFMTAPSTATFPKTRD